MKRGKTSFKQQASSKKDNIVLFFLLIITAWTIAAQYAIFTVSIVKAAIIPWPS